MKTATKLETLSGWKAKAARYKLSEPFEGHAFVIVSDVNCYSGPETLVFPAEAEGDPTSFAEIAGGRGYRDHAIALREMGYEIKSL